MTTSRRSARARTELVCEQCDTPHPKWVGRCEGCGAWNTLVERVEADGPGRATTPSATPAEAIPLAQVDQSVAAPTSTGLDELDRVLGGGLVPGSVTLVGGEPGVGKSTILLQLLGRWSGPRLYVSAEEGGAQVRARAARLGVDPADIWVVTDRDVVGIVAAIEQRRPSLVVVDSIQTVVDDGVSSTAGSVSQVRACADQLAAVARRLDVPVVLVGHVTKDGSLAGPRVLEHLVDTVVSIEHADHHALRMLRAVKHRFGPTDEIGLFEMAPDGLNGVADASALFLADRRSGVAGTVAAATVQGRRPLLAEVQALTTPSPPTVPARRTTQGVASTRLAMLLAVLHRRVGLPTGDADVYVSAVGGARLDEPAADLAVCVAVASAMCDQPIATDVVVFGELGLGGELRQSPRAAHRLREAARLGFSRAVVPANTPADALELPVVRAGTLAEALLALGLGSSRERAGMRAV